MAAVASTLPINRDFEDSKVTALNYFLFRLSLSVMRVVYG